MLVYNLEDDLLVCHMNDNLNTYTWTPHLLGIPTSGLEYIGIGVVLGIEWFHDYCIG